MIRGITVLVSLPSCHFFFKTDINLALQLTPAYCLNENAPNTECKGGIRVQHSPRTACKKEVFAADAPASELCMFVPQNNDRDVKREEANHSI